MLVRLLLAALVTAASFGCGDDEDDRGSIDAGRDAAINGMRDAELPALDARVPDGSDEDASALSDAGDGGGDAGDAGACLESSYIWSSVEACFGGASIPIARRVTLSGLCTEYGCPDDWNAALAVAAECDEDDDAGGGACWTASTECGADLLRSAHGLNGRLLYYDHATGALIGAAVQLSDAAQECVTSELIAGERPPICCEPDAGSRRVGDGSGAR